MAKPKYKYGAWFKVGAYLSMFAGFVLTVLALLFLGLEFGENADLPNQIVGFAVSFSGAFLGFKAFDAACDILNGTE